MADTPATEIGDFLRSRREKLTPTAVGLPHGGRRRTPGLRRQEVAELAGIGIDWYIRLEQGRAVRPSEATVAALARALRLDRAEQAHLRVLASGAAQRVFVRESVPAPIQRLLRSLDQPAYVTGRRWDVLAWNAAATDLFTDFGVIAEQDRNILVFMLESPVAKQRFGPTWADEAKRMVAEFRVTHDQWADDPAFVALLARLRKASPELARWWRNHDVRLGGTGEKRLRHPREGWRHYEYATFQANLDPALKLVIYTLAQEASKKSRKPRFARSNAT